VTLRAYAEATGLPVDFLKLHGVSEITADGKAAVRMADRTSDRRHDVVRLRVGWGGPDGVRWTSGSKRQPYGLSRLDLARDAGYVVLLEDEMDCHTAWNHGIPALAFPDGAAWREERDAPCLGEIPTLYVLRSASGGAALAGALRDSRLRDRVRLVSLGEGRTLHGLQVADPGALPGEWERARAAATSWADLAAEEARQRGREAWRRCAGLAASPDLLAEFDRAIERAGLTGEGRARKLLFLVVLSRLLAKPVSAVVKGPSSGGKSYLTEKVLGFFPDSAYVFRTGLSPKALFYSEEPLRHRTLVIAEAAAVQDETASYVLRTLLSEGCLKYEVSVAGADGTYRTQVAEREGPTNLLLTTTAIQLHPENETRLLSIPVNDTPEQTRQVLRALAAGAEPSADVAPWHALQEWIEAGPREVAIPFAGALAELVPPLAVRLRRDFAKVLSLIRAHALLHRATRPSDADGRIVAELGDYAAVCALVEDLVAAGIEQTVAPATRETVEAVRALHAAGLGRVGVSDVAEHLGLERTTAWRRLQVAEAGGFVRNRQQRKGLPADLVIDRPLPEERRVLPTVERLAAAMAEGAGADGGGADPDLVAAELGGP
jgi:hypothetical protein